MEYEIENGNFSFYIGPKVPQNTIAILSDIIIDNYIYIIIIDVTAVSRTLTA